MTGPSTNENDSTIAPETNGTAVNDTAAVAPQDDATGTPAHAEPLVIPDDVAAKLPDGTIVHADSGDTVVATVEKDGIIHRIAAKFGNEWHHLVAAVEQYFGASDA